MSLLGGYVWWSPSAVALDLVDDRGSEKPSKRKRATLQRRHTGKKREEKERTEERNGKESDDEVEYV